MFHIFKKSNLFKKKPEIELLQPDIDSYMTYLAISKAIKSKTPFLVSRIGYTEARSLAYPDIFENPPQKIMDSLWHSSGVFPNEKKTFKNFAEHYCNAIGDIDLLGLISDKFESLVVNQNKSSNLLKCKLMDLEPYLYSYPWSKYLENKSVLVIHPFSDSIMNNYKKIRNLLFVDNNVLPEFRLSVIKSPMTLAFNSAGFASWFEAFEFLKRNVDSIEFDVAILGCGAYGLPLGSYIKRKGKIAIHLGGATQILFGITGARWQAWPTYKVLFNSYWTKPATKEHPNNWESMEKGCYW